MNGTNLSAFTFSRSSWVIKDSFHLLFLIFTFSVSSYFYFTLSKTKRTRKKTLWAVFGKKSAEKNNVMKRRCVLHIGPVFVCTVSFWIIQYFEWLLAREAILKRTEFCERDKTTNLVLDFIKLFSSQKLKRPLCSVNRLL